MEMLTHSAEVVRTYEQVLKESVAEGRFIEIDSGYKVHVIEAGTGPPLVLLHATRGTAFTFLPLLEHLQGLRAIAPDRPGSGLSDPVDIGQKDYRDWAVEVMDQLLDVLELDQISLAGSSTGGAWAIWYALTYPERVQQLVLLGAAPLLPGGQIPLLHRIVAAPIIADIMARIPTNEKMVVNMMGLFFGEKQTIVNYPRMIEAFVAANNDPVASKTTRTEQSAIYGLLGYREHMRMRTEDLAQLTTPTLLIWGERDPFGGVDVARAVCEVIPNCVLESLPAGHFPWSGYPEETAKLVQEFVLSR